MVADMKHFASAAHASLDEKEKVEARLKRQQFDYRNELAHAEHLFEMLASELQVLEEKITQGHAAEEDFNQQQTHLAIGGAPRVPTDNTHGTGCTLASSRFRSANWSWILGRSCRNFFMFSRICSSRRRFRRSSMRSSMAS